MPRRRHRLRGHVRRWHGSWQIVLETGEQPYLQCPACREARRADGRRKGSRRWWLADGAAPTACPDCGEQLVEETDRRWGPFGRVLEVDEIYGMFFLEPGTTHTSRITFVSKLSFGDDAGFIATLGSRMPGVIRSGLRSGFDASVRICEEEQAKKDRASQNR